jgi:hypothetical protein
MLPMLQKNDQYGQATKKIWIIFRRFMFGDRHVKTISDFNIKLFLHCFVAFGVQRDLVNP